MVLLRTIIVNVSVIKQVLSFLISESGLSELELSRRMQIPAASINKLKSGRVQDPQSSTLIAIANYFNISVDQLLGNAPLNQYSIKQVDYIPLLDSKNILSTNIAELTYTNYSRWIPFNLEPGTNINHSIFALKITNNTMSPYLDENSIVIVDSSMPVSNGNYALLYIAEDQNIVLRQIFFDGVTKIAKPVNEVFSTFTLTPNDKILGVIRYSLRQFD